MVKRQIRDVVYKITFPNKKIYVGMDIRMGGHSMRYFGSWNNDLVEQDFTNEQLADFTLRKQILFESDDQAEKRKMEEELIKALGANNPAVGYNRSPKFRRAST